MRTDIMVDIETLGRQSDSTIIQISAIAFDISTGKHISKFNEVADISKNENPLVTDGSTIKWWLKTNHDLLKELLLLRGNKSSEDIIRDFHKWIKHFFHDTSKNVYLWGNGILFDNKMIQHQMEKLGLEYPIFYRNDRDVRTIVDLTAAKLGSEEEELKEGFNDDSLVAHDAFDDVKYQINLVTGCYRELTEL
ncbi:hypothetical protein GCM10008931_43990 [Oceanobacillus oncorhynchi subsp. oncorhynchi]|uniref:3'-5' exonuclease n=1 Tax=Oceanobacillus oncorhynchi TaxID=545501 RepID=UPI0031D78390